ncbi:hypothetical protein [Streptomyces sp. 8N114]
MLQVQPGKGVVHQLRDATLVERLLGQIRSQQQCATGSTPD